MMPSAPIGRRGLLPALLLALLPACARADDGASRRGLAEIGEAGAVRPFVRFAAVGPLDTRAQAGKLVRDRVRSWTPGFVLALGNGGLPAEPVETHGFAREGHADVRRGPVHVFFQASMDGPGREGDSGWLRKALAASTAPWKIVCLPRAPYSSYDGGQGPAAARGDAGKTLRWPFRQWGADVVIAGSGGHYERLEVDGIPYFVNGLEGKAAPERQPGSQCVFDEDLGAMLVEADAERMDFRFVTSEGLVVDAHSLRRASVAAGSAGRPPRAPAALPAAAISR